MGRTQSALSVAQGTMMENPDGERRRVVQAFAFVEVEQFSPLESIIFQLAMDEHRSRLHDLRENYRRDNNTDEVANVDRGLLALAEIERKLHELSQLQ